MHELAERVVSMLNFQKNPQLPFSVLSVESLDMDTTAWRNELSLKTLLPSSKKHLARLGRDMNRVVLVDFDATGSTHPEV